MTIVKDLGQISGDSTWEKPDNPIAVDQSYLYTATSVYSNFYYNFGFTITQKEDISFSVLVTAQGTKVPLWFTFFITNSALGQTLGWNQASDPAFYYIDPFITFGGDPKTPPITTGRLSMSPGSYWLSFHPDNGFGLKTLSFQIGVSVTALQVLFTPGADTVNFNALTSGQQAAISAAADRTLLYQGRGGSDTVSLPNKANYNDSVGNGQTLGWTDSAASPFTTGSLAGDIYTVNGGDGNYYIVEGAGTEFITINGNGSSNITAGSGADTVSINGNGNNTVILGSGTTTLKLNGSGLTSVAFAGAVTTPPILANAGAVSQVVNVENTGATPIRLAISNFVAGDAINFINQPNLTLSAAFSRNEKQHPGEIDVYSDSKLIAVLEFSGTNVGTFASTLEPHIDDAGTGTKVIVAPEQIALSDPQGTSIIWNFIHSNEGGNILTPYVPLPDTTRSGVTIGIGVDLANGLIRQQTYTGPYGASFPGFTTLFPDYLSNPALHLLFNATNPALIGFSAAVYLQGGAVRTTYNNRGQRTIWSTSVSITQSQANLLSNTSEQYNLTELLSLWGVKSPSTPFTALPAQAQTVLYDVGYHYGVDNLPKGRLTKQFFSDMLAAAQTISAQNPNGTPSAWVPVFNDLTHFGDNFSSRRLGEAALILQIPGVVPEQMLPPVLEQGTIVASNENYNFIVADTTTQYALDPVGSTTYVLLANAGSPNFSSIQLPLTTADQYAVSYEVGTTWSQPQIVQPLRTVNLPANVVGLQVALEDSTGSPIPDPGNFTFYVTFATPELSPETLPLCLRHRILRRPLAPPQT